MTEKEVCEALMRVSREKWVEPIKSYYELGTKSGTFQLGKDQAGVPWLIFVASNRQEFKWSSLAVEVLWGYVHLGCPVSKEEALKLVIQELVGEAG